MSNSSANAASAQLRTLRERWAAGNGPGECQGAPRPPTPMVSISMLTYNAAPFVVEAIESVLDQEVDFEVELVIGDDNSGDGTPDIIRGYVERYGPHIRAHLHAVRGEGTPGLVNNMYNLADARGKYICYLDGDDYWIDARKLYDQARFLEAHPRHSACTSDGLVVTPTSSRSRIEKYHYMLGRDITLDFYRATGSTLMIPTSLMYRADWVLPLPAWFKDVYVGDLHNNLRLLSRGPCRLLPGSYYAYRIHERNFTSTSMGSTAGLLTVFDDLHAMIHERLPGVGTSDLLERRQLQRLVRVLQISSRAGDWTTLRRAITRLRHYARPRYLRFFVHAVYSRLPGLDALDIGWARRPS